MTRLEKLLRANKILLNETKVFRDQADYIQETETHQRGLLRALMNVREPGAVSDEFLQLQDEILQEDLNAKGTISIDSDEMIPCDSKIFLWQGDITRLAVDAIVNAANSKMLGCFIPLHNCIDNAIHSAAGIQLRNACDEIMHGGDVETGDAIITPGFNLPCRFVIHTVGPIINHLGLPNENECALLKKCYETCLNLAVEKNLETIAFCCISTGVFSFDNQRAAEIAVDTVKKFVVDKNLTVIFNVFKDEDFVIYHRLLS